MRGLARDWRRLGCAAVLGAIVAFPAGVLLSGRDAVQVVAPNSETTAASPRHQSAARKPYSPHVLSDPYVLQQHEEIVEALEASCCKTGEACAEASQARRYLRQREATR
jgi:hypothetical protein